MAGTGVSLGIFAFLFSFIPVFGLVVSIPCVGVGLPLSVVSFFRARKRKTPICRPIAGLAINIVALVMTAVWVTLIVTDELVLATF